MKDILTKKDGNRKNYEKMQKLLLFAYKGAEDEKMIKCPGIVEYNEISK